MTEQARWPDIAKELRRVLADGLDVGGTIDETEVLTHVGSASLEIVIEASDLQAGEQASAYTVLCDLLETRLRGGCSQVVGCLLFASEPDRRCRRRRRRSNRECSNAGFASGRQYATALGPHRVPQLDFIDDQ